MVKIKKGLNLPISGEAKSTDIDSFTSSKVALVGQDYLGMKPTMKVKIGDQVEIGQVLFEDKKNPGVVFTSPGAGELIELNRGDRRVFQSVVIKTAQEETHVSFSSYKGEKLESYTEQELRNLLVESGSWTALRARPFSKIPSIQAQTQAIFVTAMDTNPLAPNPEVVIAANKEAFESGLQMVRKLTEGEVFLCIQNGSEISTSIDSVKTQSFSGPHPAGNPGTHIHFLKPAHHTRSVWYLNYQEVIAWGKLLESGKLFLDRVITLAGPLVKNPRYIQVRKGACLNELVKGEFYPDGQTRVISGSVFNGRSANYPFCFLGNYHQQVTILKEGNFREFMGWRSPGFDKFSVKNIYASAMMKWKKFDFTTNLGGSKRPLVPIGSFEQVMPLDILPTPLIRALLSGDNEMAQKLGVLELDEEDLALCTFVDPSKHDFGSILRERLSVIEKEG